MMFTDNGIFGFDVSLYQDSNLTPQQIDFLKMKAYGASFCISKAGQWYYQDPDFQYNWKESKLAVVPRASYWFGDARSDGKTQAQIYFNILINNGYYGEMCFIDYETGSWTNWDQLYNFIAELERLLGTVGYSGDRIGIYTGYYYWLEHCPPEGPSRDWFKKYVLWLAQYNTTVNLLKVPSPWTLTECLIWQSGTPAIGIEAGVESKDIDYNVFNGDIEKLKIYFSGVTSVPDEEPPGEISMYKGTTLVGLNVRSVPTATGNSPLFTMPTGTKVEADRIEAKWWHLTKIDDVVVTAENWAFEGDSSGFIRLDEVITEPPAETHLVEIKILIDGVLKVEESFDV